MTRSPASAQAQRSAAQQGELWGAHARDWAEVQEPQFSPLYVAALAAWPFTGRSLLDVGCGAGGFCALAERSGAQVYGLDAAAELIAVARERASGAVFCTGTMEQLPYPDDFFDLVTGFNVVGHSEDSLRAVREVARVARTGAHVGLSTWGRPEACDATALFAALERLRAPFERSCCQPGRRWGLEEFFDAAGLVGLEREEVPCPWIYADADAALRGIMSAGPFVSVARLAGEERLRETLLEALAPFRTNDGYRLQNHFSFLTATVG